MNSEQHRSSQYNVCSKTKPYAVNKIISANIIHAVNKMHAAEKISATNRMHAASKTHAEEKMNAANNAEYKKIECNRLKNEHSRVQIS